MSFLLILPVFVAFCLPFGPTVGAVDPADGIRSTRRSRMRSVKCAKRVRATPLLIACQPGTAASVITIESVRRSCNVRNDRASLELEGSLPSEPAALSGSEMLDRVASVGSATHSHTSYATFLRRPDLFRRTPDQTLLTTRGIF
jgi:hypothetical protein